jgi:O-acetyl-ADP-ribose deacetylase (regulator of RNase III)
MPQQRPTVFIGSSTKSIEVARQVRSHLADVAEVTVWDEDVFPPSETFIASLVKATQKYDFAVLVLGGDDQLQAPNGVRLVPRDNVVFEFGLFMGCLGRSRCFAVYDKDDPVKIPSDLAGVSLGGFHGQRSDGNLKAAVGTVCQTIRDAIRREGPRRGSRDVTTLLAKVRAHDCGSSFDLRGTQIEVSRGLIQDAASDDETGIVLPANEFFDDDCVNDPNSALGAFVQHFFEGQVPAFQQLVAHALAGRPTTRVQKRSGVTAESYGVGECVVLDRPLGKPLRMLLVAVTTDRHPQGLQSDMHCVVDGVRKVLVEAHQHRIWRLAMPLMGAGHGGLTPELSLSTMLLALADAIHVGVRGPASVTILVYPDPKTPSSRRSLSLDAIQDIVCASVRCAT